MRPRLLLLALLVAVAGCGDDDTTSTPKPTPTTTTTTTNDVRTTQTFSGTARISGEPVDTDHIGAVVRDNGLITPCQAEVPAVAGGHYEIDVLAASAALGCGRDGAEVLLWIYFHGEKTFTTNVIPWPIDNTNGDADFSATEPLGALGTPITELNGTVTKEGIRMPVGTKVEAFVDDTRCAVASVRDSDGYVGFIMNIVGPELVPGCRVGGTVSFRVDGEPAVETSVNAPEHSGTLDLTVA